MTPTEFSLYIYYINRRRTEEEVEPTVGLPRHRHFAGFFNVPVQTPTRDPPLYGYSEKPPHFSRLLRHAWGYGWHILDLNPRVPTGGSKSKDYVSASAVSSVDILKVNIPTDTSIFTAEALALKLAVQHIQSQTLQRTFIYSDSLSCLQALKNKNLKHSIIREILHILTYLKEVGSQIEFCWIPSHIGIKGNEKADRIAKRVPFLYPSTE